MAANHLVVKSIRFNQDEWAAIESLAAAMVIEPAVLIRRLTMKAVRSADAGALKAEVDALRAAQDALFS